MSAGLSFFQYLSSPSVANTEKGGHLPFGAGHRGSLLMVELLTTGSGHVMMVLNSPEGKSRPKGEVQMEAEAGLL